MPPHDDLEQEFARAFRQVLDSHIVQNQQVRLQVLRHHAVVIVEGFVVEQIADSVEDAAVEH